MDVDLREKARQRQNSGGVETITRELHITYSELTPELSASALDITQTWMQPVDGECPSTHTVKACYSSGKYYLPGDRTYEKQTPDCCYSSSADAEDDGFKHGRW